jgi:transglutaminase-like putative cysteine protease
MAGDGGAAAPALEGGREVTDAQRDELPALAALVLLDLVAAVCLGRLFTSVNALGPIVAAVLVGHAIAFATRVRSFTPSATAAAIVLAGVFTAIWTVVPHSTAYGLPTPHSFGALWDALSVARRDFAVAIAPTPPTEGFMAACVMAVMVLVTLADWAAFRMRTTIEAAVPAFTLFTFAAVLGTATHRSTSTVGFAGALLVWFVADNVTIVARTRPWFQGTADAGRRALSRAGIGIGTIGLVGALVGLAVPFAQDPPAVAWRNHNRTRARTTISPLVDIRSRLVSRSDVVAFAVKTPLRSYWRLTSLDVFDGDIWSSKGSYKDVDDDDTLKNRPGTVTAQNYSIGNLRSIWLPVAYRPASTPSIKGISYDEDADAFITEQPTSDGLTYSVRSAVQSLTPDALRQARADLRVSNQEVALPTDVDGRVVALAQQVTRGKPTAYDKALAIQQYLRSSPFRYDLSVPPGHGEDAISRFLVVTRRGYCEQFAGTYAVLARLAGLPTRVAVGFTSGEFDATTGTWTVRELHAHAWPEVFLGSAGWVAFEPTPGRGMPGAQSYTGATESQADSRRPATASTAVPTTVRQDSSGQSANNATTTTVATTTTAPAKTATRHGSVWRVVATVVLGLIALAAIIAIVPLVVTARRRRRWASAETPTQKVLVAWSDTDEALAFAGAPVRRSHTPRERVASVGDTIGDGGVATLTRLADIVDVAAYAADDVSVDDAESAWRDASAVRKEAFATKPWWKQALFAINPRRLRG